MDRYYYYRDPEISIWKHSAFPFLIMDRNTNRVVCACPTWQDAIDVADKLNEKES